MQEILDTYHSFNLEHLYSIGFFCDLDYFFARSMKRISKETDAMVIATCGLLTRMLQDGHICVSIPQTGGTHIQIPGENEAYFKLPDKEIWLQKLNESNLVSKTVDTPLVIDKADRIYLARFYDFQTRLIRNIKSRIQNHDSHPLSKDILAHLGQWFDPDRKKLHDQKKALLGAVTNRFSVVTGGPGTGKTYISKAIKQIFTMAFVSIHGREPDILCLAPTGKAASKMEQGKTIHRTLKPQGSKPGFLYHKNRQLQADLVIVDEASMVDLTLLTRLLEAVPLEAHIVLMGDQDQLASVQAGSVFSDICRSKRMACAIHRLNHNFRSGEKKGIHALSLAVNKNDFSTVQQLLNSTANRDLKFVPLGDSKDVHALIEPIVREGFRAFLEAANPMEALDKINDFKVLCAQNLGTFGTLPINHFCENILRTQNNFDITRRPFYKLVMVTVNDYKKELFNGDTGVLEGSGLQPPVYFRQPQDRIKRVAYSQMPAHETAFAITVHKAQGSEYDKVLLLIPDQISPVLTRQLLYTGVTRARNKVIIVADPRVVKAAMERHTNRYSGIRDGLEARWAEN